MAHPALEVLGASKSFLAGGRRIDAVRDVSLRVEPGEFVGLVGESGCGKSTLARLISRIDTPDAGRIILCGEDISTLKGVALRRTYINIKMVFQDSRSSFDPRLTIGSSIREALKAFCRLPRGERAAESARLLKEVGLDAEYDALRPLEISGGECQRAAIARAIACPPRLLICDEATSALDVSIQAQILELLKQLGEKHGMSILFISHDLALVSGFCARTYVMRDGKIAEWGETAQIIANPRNDYTKKLVLSSKNFEASLRRDIGIDKPRPWGSAPIPTRGTSSP
jgi:peptide/nickel transport system ATP-binding protein